MRRGRGWSRDPADVIVPCVVAACLLVISAAQHLGGPCDWSLSSPPDEHPPRRVTTLSSACAEGSLEWRAAAGGVQLKLSHVAPQGQGRRGCFRFRSRRVPLEALLRRGGESRRLALLDGTDNVTPEVCLELPADEAGPWVVLLDVSGGGSTLLGHVTVDYVLGEAAQQSGECEPCGEDELLSAFCDSAFALQGKISSTNHVPQTEYTQLTVSPEVTFRGEHHPRLRRTSDEDHVLYVPRKCEASAGKSSYVMIGHFRFGRPVVRCVASAKQWHRLRRSVTSSGKPPPCWLGDD